MSFFTYFKKSKLLTATTFLFLLILSDSVLAAPTEKDPRLKSKAGAALMPPPIPSVNSPEFREYVRKYHTFPSPYGFEPYLDRNKNEMKFPLKDLNPGKSYIPVTFYCNSRTSCPTIFAAVDGQMQFSFEDQSTATLALKSKENLQNTFVGYYYPDDPVFYKNNIAVHVYNKKILKDESIVTVLFSQDILKKVSEPDSTKGTFKGIFAANGQDISLPSSDGEETVTVGTTLGLLGLGVASGVEFSETVSQTTGETYTSQVQTGFSVNLGLEAQITVGGGIVPTSESFKFSVNETLSSMVSNGVSIADQRTVSRTYTIKPGINETYYWGIYQLLYSYRINAPELEKILKEVQTIWGDKISMKIGDNQITEDGKLIGNPLPPQESGLANDVTVGVAVPVDSESKGAIHSELLTVRK